MFPPSLPTLIVIESEETSISHLNNSDMLKTSFTCLINLMKNPSNLIQNLLELSKFCLFFMLNTNLTVPLLLWDIYHHLELMYTPVLQEPQALYMVLSMEEPTKLFWECFNKLEKNKTFLNLLRTLKVERNFFTDLVIEFTKVMTQELK